MNFNKKYLLIIPIIIISVATMNFLKDKFSPMRFSGTVEATQIVISSRLNSNIKNIEIKEGDIVKKDSILISLECEDINVTFSRLFDDYDRAKKLLTSGAGSKESFEKAKSLFNEIEVKKSWCDIKSPIDGVVTNNFHEVGEYVTPGTKLLSVLDKNNYWVYFFIPQTLINKFNPGDSINLVLPETSETFLGKVIKINETAEFTPKNVQTFDERARLVYGIKVKVENKENRLKPGMSLDMEIKR
jgi:HlyD family secretion protein